MFTTDTTSPLKAAVEEASGPGCIQKAGYEDDDDKITYANRGVLFEALGISDESESGGGPGCIRKANFDDEDAKITYANQADLHKALGIPAEVAVVAPKNSSGPAAVPKPAVKKVEKADKSSAVVEERPANPNERIYGVVNTKRLNKLYDLVVIGGGPAGVAGAIKAAQMGRRAILIDKVCVVCLYLFFVYAFALFVVGINSVLTIYSADLTAQILCGCTSQWFGLILWWAYWFVLKGFEGLCQEYQCCSYESSRCVSYYPVHLHYVVQLGLTLQPFCL